MFATILLDYFLPVPTFTEIAAAVGVYSCYNKWVQLIITIPYICPCYVNSRVKPVLSSTYCLIKIQYDVLGILTKVSFLPFSASGHSCSSLLLSCDITTSQVRWGTLEVNLVRWGISLYCALSNNLQKSKKAEG